MARKMIESCPTCNGALVITEVRCTRCDTQVRATYRPDDFSRLSGEQSTFLRIFVTSRGNLSEVEKRLGVSYPTVRAKLDEVIERLNAPEPQPAPDVETGTRGVEDSLGGVINAAVRRAMQGLQAGRMDVSGAPDAPPAAQPEPRPAPAAPSADRRAILDAVARGELTAAEGLERIRALGGVS